jgi:hypothetical protein
MPGTPCRALGKNFPKIAAKIGKSGIGSSKAGTS